MTFMERFEVLGLLFNAIREDIQEAIRESLPE